MRIGQLTGYLSPKVGGLWEAVHGLARAVTDEGVETKVFGLCAEDTEFAAAGISEVAIECAPVWIFGRFGYAPGMGQALRKWRPDLLHCHGLWMYPSWVSFRQQMKGGGPVVIAPHGMLDPWALRKSRWKKRLVGMWFEYEHLRRAACLHALNTAEAHALRKLGLKNPICIIPNGVSRPHGEISVPPPWAMVVGGGRKVLLFLGRKHPKKGLTLLIDAWGTIVRQDSEVGNEWCVVIAGWDEGRYEKRLGARIRDMGLERHVFLLGPLSGAMKKSAFQNASAFVLPSLSEGLPVAVLEAWSYSLPVLMTDACNLPEESALGASIVVRPTVADLVEGLELLVKASDAVRAEMGKIGRRIVEERYSWRRVALETKRMYEWILGGGAPPRCVMTEY